MTSRSVLTTSDLLKIITSYQDGVFHDILPWLGNGQMFLKWKDKAIHYKHSRTTFPDNKKAYLGPLSLAILSGDFEIVKRIAKCRPHLVDAQSFEYALGTQNKEMTQYLIKLNGGNFEFEYLDISCTFQFILSVVRMDNVELLHILREYMSRQYDHIFFDCFSYILQGGNSNCALYLYEIFRENGTFPPGIVNEAAKIGHLELITRLHEDNAAFTTDAMDLAAFNGHLNIVQFLHENRTEGCTKRAMDRAAGRNHINIVKFLHFNRHEGCKRETLVRVVQRNNTEMVKFLIDNRPEDFTSDALDFALFGRSKKIIKILLESKRLKFSQDALEIALANDQPDEVMLFAQIYPESIPREALIQKALQEARLNVAYHLKAAGFPFHLPRSMVKCMTHPKAVEIFQWLVAIEIPLQPQWVNQAEVYGEPPLVEFFKKNIPEEAQESLGFKLFKSSSKLSSNFDKPWKTRKSNNNQ
ncbi:ankyrin repeat [Thraustotheca clavata]|uniref:Ankyrin repeat n=1 Tax=Thraustotheca clavata TaxID=74557 RepID=A0A1V9ZCT7_9STRA|nr:ankyrin repeat [Thraustotheca clavata]